ncbi:MAG: tetratricopeptide repeat protein, partial [Gemmatimonadales bacterium]
APLAELLVTGDPGVEAMMAAARVRLLAGNPVGALDLVRIAQARAPGRADILQLQARVAAQLGQVDAAIEACHAALQLDTARAQLWYDLGALEERREDWSAARSAYEDDLDLLPTYAVATLALADLSRRTGEHGEAIQLLVSSLDTDPYDIDALILLGRTLVDAGRPARALEAFIRVLRFEPDRPEALYHAGVALTRLRRFADAVRAWERVTRLSPQSDLAKSARAQSRSARDLQFILTRQAS